MSTSNLELEEFEFKILEALREMFHLPEKFSQDQGGFGSIQPTVGNSSLAMVNYFPITSHSHCTKSLSFLDIQHMRSIPSIYSPESNTFNMDVQYLESLIQKDKSEGLIPFFCMGVMGTTSTGGNDDFSSIGAICKKNL